MKKKRFYKGWFEEVFSALKNSVLKMVNVLFCAESTKWLRGGGTGRQRGRTPPPPLSEYGRSVNPIYQPGGKIMSTNHYCPPPHRFLDFPPSLSVTLQQIIRNSWVGELRHDMKVAKKVSCQYLQFRSKVKMHTFRFCYWGSILDRNKRQNVIWP